MNGRVVCFGSREAAEGTRQPPDERITDWVGYRTARGEPDKVLEVSLGAGAAALPGSLDRLRGNGVGSPR